MGIDLEKAAYAKYPTNAPNAKVHPANASSSLAVLAHACWQPDITAPP